VGVNHLAFAVDRLLRKVVRVDAAREKLGSVKVEVFCQSDCVLKSVFTAWRSLEFDR